MDSTGTCFLPPIMRHDERKVPQTSSKGDPKLIRTVTRHVEKHIGPVDWVFHDMISDVVHLDLLWVRARPNAPYHTFVTCGMSEKPMNIPESAVGFRHTELLLRLPASWKLESEELEHDRNIWPLFELGMVARMPHIYDSWLGWGHIVANGDPPELIPGSDRFAGAILALPSWLPREARRIRVDKKRLVRLFSVIPLDREELRCSATEEGTAVDHRFELAQLSDIVDVDRKTLR